MCREWRFHVYTHTIDWPWESVGYRLTPFRILYCDWVLYVAHLIGNSKLLGMSTMVLWSTTFSFSTTHIIQSFTH